MKSYFLIPEGSLPSKKQMEDLESLFQEDLFSEDLFSIMLEDFNSVFGEKCVKVDDGVYVTQFEVPGFNKSNLTVKIGDGYATIKGERKLSQENYIGKSRISKRFNVGDPKDVKATVKNGILTLTLWYDVTKSNMDIDFEDSPKEV
jgi:HSP20 family molecular chaperone IbpA